MECQTARRLAETRSPLRGAEGRRGEFGSGSNRTRIDGRPFGAAFRGEPAKTVHFDSMSGAGGSLHAHPPKLVPRDPKEQPMPDDQTKRGAADRARINVNEDYEL